jgi:hypothetical protein
VTVLQPPVHRELVGDTSVRFFSSPEYLESGAPDMPWHSCDDLWQALGIDQSGRMFFLRSLRAEWCDPRTVATSSGPVVIAPYLMGDIIIDEWISQHRTPGASDDDDDISFRRLRGSFRRGNTAALKAMTPHLDGMGKLAFSLDAISAMDDLRSKWEL